MTTTTDRTVRLSRQQHVRAAQLRSVRSAPVEPAPRYVADPGLPAPRRVPEPRRPVEPAPPSESPTRSRPSATSPGLAQVAPVDGTVAAAPVAARRSRHRASRPGADGETMVLRYVQPGLVGFIDGTLSTLAPIFAAALISGSRAALFIGLATALGAGISMGLSEALSDDGSQTGRGSATSRGAVTGVMTTVGGVLHALPFLLADTRHAIVVAAAVVAVELGLIAYVRKRYMDVSMSASLVQVVLGGIVIVGVGLLLGAV